MANERRPGIFSVHFAGLEILAHRCLTGFVACSLSAADRAALQTTHQHPHQPGCRDPFVSRSRSDPFLFILQFRPSSLPSRPCTARRSGRRRVRCAPPRGLPSLRPVADSLPPRPRQPLLRRRALGRALSCGGASPLAQSTSTTPALCSPTSCRVRPAIPCSVSSCPG